MLSQTKTVTVENVNGFKGVVLIGYYILNRPNLIDVYFKEFWGILHLTKVSAVFLFVGIRL